MRVFSCVLVAACVLSAARARSLDGGDAAGSPRIHSGDELLSKIVNECFGAASTADCLKVKVLTYLDTLLGLNEASTRAFSSENIDKVIFDRAGRVLNENEFRLRLPELVFQNAEVSYRTDRGLDMSFPEDAEADSGTSEARGLLKKKLLLPILLLFKLKMKALMPIFVALIGLKALKALVLSKVAILLVVGFLVMSLLKKGGMPMAMAMAPTPEPSPPPSAYGPAAPAASAAPDSYSPHWEPSSGGGPYARVWEPSSSSSAHQAAYSAYYPGSSSSYSSPSSSSSYSSPSASSVSVSSSSSR